MNVAILIGISNYLEERNDLPGCENDIEGLELLIRKSNKYDKILVIKDDVNSSKVKRLIANAVNELKELDVNELFFYYTGHGYHDSKEFYYILKDYNENRLNQTSLSNNELDSMFRSLSPNLTVKIVDACQSSHYYVKSNDNFEKYINKTADRYNNCYFLFSSLMDQPSYQDDKLSFFTYSILQSIVNSKDKQIRYKDIIDVVSDDFLSEQKQTPFFITQANFTDIFIDNADEIKGDLKDFLNDYSHEVEDKDIGEEEIDFITIIKEKAKGYLSEEKAMEYLQMLNNYIEDYDINNSLHEIYDCDLIKTSDYYNIPNDKDLNNWIDRNKELYFVKVKEKYEEYKEDIQVRKNRGLGSIGSTLDSFYGPLYETTTVTKERRVINGFDITVKVPFKVINLTLTPKLENLSKQSLYLIYIFNKKQFVLFSNIAVYQENNWDEWFLDKSSGWETTFLEFKDVEKIKEIIKNNIESFFEKADNDLKEKFLAKEG